MALKLITACSTLRSSTRLTFSFFSRSLVPLSKDTNVDVPKKPKRPLSAFFEFAVKNRSAVVENNPGIDSRDVIRRISEIYKNLADSEKQVLREQAQVRLQAYKEEYAQFIAGLSDEQVTALKESSSKKKENRAKRRKKLSERKYGRPRRPMNSYAIFVQASKVERGNLPFVVFSKQLANTWKNMPKEEKEIYNEEARVEREKYTVQMMKWEKLMLEEGRSDLIRGYRRPSKKVKKVKKAIRKKKVLVKAKKPKVRKSKRAKKKTKSTKAPKAVSKARS